MKKRIALVLSLVALGLVFTGCQEGGESGNPALPTTDRAEPQPRAPVKLAEIEKSLDGISATTSVVSMNTFFFYRDYGPKQDCMVDHSFIKAWNPGNSVSACQEPTDPFTYDIWGQSYCHFKILDETGDCILFNSSLWGPTSPGHYRINIHLPVGEELTTDNISLFEPSDYTTMITLNYYQAPGFQLEKGQTYTFQITEQVAGCDTSRDGELVRYEVQVSIPCCEGIRGNVDGDSLDQVDISDLNAMVDFIFHGGEISCLAEADVDGDGQVDISDLVYLVDFMFQGGPAPVACD
jgi:hypothetical protein